LIRLKLLGRLINLLTGIVILFSVLIASSNQALAQAKNVGGITLPTVSLGFTSTQKPEEVVNVIKMIIMLTVLTLAPAILIMMTCFTRIVVVLAFLRQALGTQQMPPNQLLIGLSLFLTFFIMSPFLSDINTKSLQPYLKGSISQEVAGEELMKPLRKFMFAQTRPADLTLFIKMGRIENPKTRADVPSLVLIPAFVISELKTAFEIGFIIYLPFLIIDMVVASVLMAMGMMMVPPIVVSLPFKLMVFVLIDGWQLIVGSLVKSFG
jgi:flagellar biosynthetic protein FliP